MNRMTLRCAMVVAALGFMVPVVAGGGFGGGGYGGGAGGFGRGNVDYIRQQVGFSDEEWTVIQAKLQKVLDCQAALHLTNNGRGGFGGGQAGAGAGAADPVLAAQQELTAALQEQGSVTETIAAKLKALRDSRIRARENLAAAQADLIKVLTVRQEALLVNMGYLE